MDIQIPISQKEQKAGITLQEQIDIPIQQPEYSYLNQFIDREDTTWQEIVLAEDGWDYKQEGLTPAGAAIVGSQTVGAMAGAAFSSLTNLASVSLINNQGDDVEAILKELGPKDNVKQLTLAITSAGISHKIDKSLGLKGIDITQTGFDQRLVKVIANSTSTSLLQTAVYGSDFEENLKKNLRMQFATVATQDTFLNIVKDLDGDTLSDNITHKLAAGLTGCLSAKAAGNRCEAGSIGAVVGEMWGDYQVDDPNTLTQAQKNKLINQAKLIAGITAVFAGEDVNVAAGVAAEAVENNTFAEIYPNEWDEIVNNTDGSYGLELHEAISRNKQYILIGTSFIPVVGDIQGFVEAKTAGDYVFATIGLIPGLGDVAQKAHKAKKAYDTAKSANDVKGIKSAIQEGVDVLKAEGRATKINGAQVIKKVERGEITPAGTLPSPKKASERRSSPGKAFSSTSLQELKIGESLFKGGNSAPVPKQVADKLSGGSFSNFDEFRSAFWKEMANDPAVAQNFNPQNLALMRQGNAPYAIPTQQVGERKVYELDHNIEIQHGGTIYNLDNIIIRTPKDHINKGAGRK